MFKNLQITAFRQNSKGELGRSHNVLAECLCHCVDEDQKNLDEQVPFMSNTTVHTHAGYTPFKFVNGCPSALPLTLHEVPSAQYDYENYVIELKESNCS
jgi:hypothetical protein